MRSAVGLALLLLLPAVAAQAQTPPEAPPPPMDAPPPPPPAEMPPPAMAPPPPMPVTPAVETTAKPVTNTETMAATRPEVLPPIDVGAWTRVGATIQGATDKSKVNDLHFDTEYIELHAGGKIHKKVGVTLNLNSNLNTFSSGAATAVQIEDAIISFDFMDEFHVWVGHLLVPVDRANASGPFFMIPWNYPGFFSGVSAPKEGPSGRNNGAVIWGDISGGKLTYLAGVFDNGDVATSPLYSGRVRLALWDAEPGFWGNASYFGDKDLLSIGVGGQFQKHGSASATADKDWAEFNADLLVEKKIPGGGWFTAEGAYYHFNVLDGGISDSMFGLLAYATPTIGVGNIQPMVRYQWEKVKSGMGTNPWNLDAAVSYLIKGPALRLIATYSHTRAGTDPVSGSAVTYNSIQLGAQAIFF
ncbi:MAG TPA: hypothetical protein VGP07_22965 [Polyangia bacterium]|jgi:hypothetical protein